MKYRLKKDCDFTDAVINKNSVFTAESGDGVIAYLKGTKFNFAFKLKLQKEYILGCFRDKKLRWVPKKILTKIA